MTRDRLAEAAACNDVEGSAWILCVGLCMVCGFVWYCGCECWTF